MDKLVICYLTLLTLTLIESSYTPSGSNRFPQLQRVLDRITTETKQYPSPYHRNTESPYPYRHLGKQQQKSVTSDEEYEDEHEEDDDEEEEEVTTPRSRMPAMKLPYSTSSSYSETSTMSAISNFKWQQWGRREKVDEGFKNSRTNSQRNTPKQTVSDGGKANEHRLRMHMEAQCRVPRAKVIRVSDVHESPDRAYVPQCTLLYRCGNDTGCCKAGHTCAPKKQEQVELYFQSTFHGGSSSVERLMFTNHTECECQNEREDMMPRDMAVGGHHQPQTSFFHTRSDTCRCTKMFAVRRLSSGGCACDCFDSDRECLRQKRGKEYLTHDDKQCIERRICQPPACEYGIYRALAGRCPKKHEKYHTEY